MFIRYGVRSEFKTSSRRTSGENDCVKQKQNILRTHSQWMVKCVSRAQRTVVGTARSFPRVLCRCGFVHTSGRRRRRRRRRPMPSAEIRGEITNKIGVYIFFFVFVSVCYSTKIIVLPSKRRTEKNEVICGKFFAALRHEHANNTGRHLWLAQRYMVQFCAHVRDNRPTDQKRPTNILVQRKTTIAALLDLCIKTVRDIFRSICCDLFKNNVLKGEKFYLFYYPLWHFRIFLLRRDFQKYMLIYF